MRRRCRGVAAAVFFLPLLACSVPTAHVPAGRLYVTSGFTDEIWILDAVTGEEIGRRDVNRRRGETDEPHGVVVSRDGAHWYATLAHGAPTLWKYETKGDRLVGRLELGTRGASRIGLTPDGDRAFVPDYWRGEPTGSGEVAAVRLEDLTVLNRASVCPAPHDAQPSPSGEVVAVTCALSDEIMLLDGGTLAPRARFFVAPDAGSPGAPRYRPMNVLWSADGAVLYVTLMGAGEVRAFREDGSLGGRAPVGSGPAQIAWVGSTLVAANRGDSSVSFLETSPNLLEVARVELPGADHPHGVAADPAGAVVYITYEGTVDTPGGVIAIDARTREELWRSELGSYVLGVAWGPPV